MTNYRKVLENNLGDDYSYAMIESIDRRSPMRSFCRYRFYIVGRNLAVKYTNWMTNAVGPSNISYNLARHYAKRGMSFGDEKWVLRGTYATRGPFVGEIFFNEECEPLVFLTFG